ncbi:putative OmpA/MotB domain protein [uncultured Paludibacter sp.]|nr:putative OmpA/MotB domain protein [uncultured Paludibacter sp.]
MKKLFLGVLLIASAITFTNAQTTTTEASKWSIALKGGGDYFRITPQKEWKKNINWGAGLSIERTVNPLVGFGLNVDYLNYKNSADVAGTTLDPSLFMSINLSNLLLPHRTNGNFNAYANFGAGVGLQMAALGNDIADAAGEDTYNPLAYVGLAIEQNLSRRVAIGLESTYRGYQKEMMGGEMSKDRWDDALTVMATLRFKLGSLTDHVRGMTMDQFYPAPPPVVKQVENPYDDSALTNRLNSADKRLDDIESRLAALEQGLKDLANKPVGATVNASFQNIEFEFDSDKLTDASYPTLNEIATLLKNNPTWGKLTVKGNTDNIGPDAYNQGLSERRAETVKDYLVSQGVSESMLSTVGYGETQPIASNDTAEGRQKNRRVEFEIVK